MPFVSSTVVEGSKQDQPQGKQHQDRFAPVVSKELAGKKVQAKWPRASGEGYSKHHYAAEITSVTTDALSGKVLYDVRYTADDSTATLEAQYIKGLED